MSNKLEITMSIKDEQGNVITRKTSEREVPYIGEIEQQGFRTAFHELETAFLEGRKEVSDSALSEYLSEMSQKKQKVRHI